MYGDVFFSQTNEPDCENEKKVVSWKSLLQKLVPDFQDISAGNSTLTVIAFRNDVARKILRTALSVVTRKTEAYIERTVLSIIGLVVWITALVCGFRGG